MIASAKALADRSVLAKEKSRLLSRPGWITHIIDQARQIESDLQQDVSISMRQHSDRLREMLFSGTELTDDHLLASAAAGVVCAVRQTLGLGLFDVQIHAGIAVTLGAVAEMQTGEGKTLAGILPAYVHALLGRGVHVATTNEYLAQRDCERLAPIFDCLGMTARFLQQSGSDEDSHRAYQADVTYGSGVVFGFDYLMDQQKHVVSDSMRVGASVFKRLAPEASGQSIRQRGLNCAIIDEIDHVLLDDAVSPLILSQTSQGTALDAEIHLAAKEVATNLISGVDFSLSGPVVELTESGFDRVYQHGQWAVDSRLARPWHEYVLLSLRAQFLFHRNVHYVLVGDEVQIVDSSTGRIFEDRTWSAGLHQAVLANEGLPITPETRSLAKITRQRFYRYYETLGGMTGTATGCEKEFSSVYGLPVCVVPLRISSKRKMMDHCITDTVADKVVSIGDEVEKLHRQGRATLIGTLSIEQSQEIAAELSRRGLGFQLLNGIQDADEAAIVAKAGQKGAITVATNMAGRGTDIKLDEFVLSTGGLHVIVVEHHGLSRVDRQLIGRCARCGDPGTARYYLSAEDKFVTAHAPWMRGTVSRGVTNEGSLVRRRIVRAQQLVQSKASRLRWRMLEIDQDNEALLDSTPDPAGCWQL